MASETIGFIGVGLMGHGMAKNIVQKGYPLTVMGHRNRAPVEDLLKRGAKEAKTPREVASASSVVFLCVTGSAQVEELAFGTDGLMAGAHKGLIVVDCSTSDPSSTMRLHKAFGEAGITFVDAPLSRTPKEAQEGTLATMVGADEATFARLKPVLETWAATIVHIGGPGDGHRMKLLNNFVSMGYAALYSEALALGQKVGIDPKRFDSVLRGGRMDCGTYQTFMSYVLDGNREAHKFTLVNALKDLRYVESMANAAGIANHVGNAVKNSFAAAVVNARPGDYVPMLSDAVATANGVSLKS